MSYMIQGLNAEWVRKMREQGTCVDAVYEATGTYVEASIDDYTAYDRGDLCSELDRVLGDLIERTMHRYMPRKIAQSVRRNKISELADSVIGYDQTHGESNSNSA